MMDIRIYQINMDRDKDRVAFEGLDRLQHYQDSPNPNADVYDKSYEGSVECNDLESVYIMFNRRNHPLEYCRRSLSVSDVVEVVSAPHTEPGFYFCDRIGFTKVKFEPVQTTKPKDTIRVVILEPNKLARVADITASLDGMQRIVGGMIEAYYPFKERVCFVVNDEGKINGMPLNRAVYGDGNVILDIIAGPAFICKCSGENFGSLSEEQLNRYQKQYHCPERFFRINGNIKARSYNPNQEQER